MKCNANLSILVRSLKYAALPLKKQDLQQIALNTTRMLHFSLQISLQKRSDFLNI